MLGNELPLVMRLFFQQVEAHPGGNKQVPNPLDSPQAFQQVHCGSIIDLQMRTGFGKQTTVPAALAARFSIAAAHAIHVSTRAADIADRATKTVTLCQMLYFLANGLLRTGLDKFALMLGNGAEGTAPAAATMAGHRVTDLLKSRNGLVIVGMGLALKGQSVEAVEAGRVQGQRRRVDQQPASAVALQQRSSTIGIDFASSQAKGFVESGRVIHHRFKGG